MAENSSFDDSKLDWEEIWSLDIWTPDLSRNIDQKHLSQFLSFAPFVQNDFLKGKSRSVEPLCLLLDRKNFW